MNTSDDALGRARLFAALSGPFEPRQILQSLEWADNPDRLAMLATDLAEACDTSPVGAGNRWLMRTSVRYSVLKSLDRSQLAAEVVRRRNSDPDLETADLLAVLLDEPPLARADIQAIIDAAGDRAQIERVIIALDRAGEAAPARDLLQPARSALAGFHRTQALRRVVERGFFGREVESAQIAQWLSRPVHTAPVTCLFVTGGPGIGKSTLLAESVRRHHELCHPLVLRFDFDRAGLDVQDQLGLTMEAARQLAEQVGSNGRHLLDARLDAGLVREPSAKQQLSHRQILPEALAMELGNTVTSEGRPVLVVLDTLEVLRGRGETHPENLFHWLDSLVAKGVKPMHVLAAGRGDALDSLREIGSRGTGSPTADKRPERIRRLELLGLEDDAAQAFLARLDTPMHLRNEVLELAQGNPLKLRLAAEIARRSGVDHLPRRKRGSEVSAAFLYRLLLSRIEDPDLRRLAYPGLIVRRINADLIRKVLAPKLGLGSITQERADGLLRQLATHHWLVEHDTGAPGFLKHRSDMRTLLLPLLYQSAPAQTARIDAAALRWFAALPQTWAQVEAVYHQLQLTRTGHTAPTIPLQIAIQLDAQTLDELPRTAADLVRFTRGERTSQFRGTQPAGGAWGDGAGMARELLTVAQRQDWSEGAYLVRSAMDAGGLDVRSQTADAIRTFLWRSGQWAQARHWLAERDRFDDSDKDLGDLPEPFALARLEMRAEFAPDALRRRWQEWRPALQRLDNAAISATDNAARHGALALLLAHLPEPFHFSRAESRESDLATAARERWLDGKGNEAAFAEKLGRERLHRLAPEAEPAGALRYGRVLATLTPYPAFAGNLLTMEGRGVLREMAGEVAQVIASAGGLLGEQRREPMAPPESGQMGWLVDLGLFAEWAEATAFVRQDGDLRLIGRAAERWRRTMAGNWSIGRPRGDWRQRPPLDETLSLRLADLLREPDPAERARQQIGMWAEGLMTDALLALVRRRLRGVLLEAAMLAAEPGAPEIITRRLLARGAPAAFAPALAVLILHREL